jgi:glyoxylase-like metal-dependent hydrolase (beta-lactamase superfamily II)
VSAHASEVQGTSGWERRSVQAGDWRITALSDGYMRLDGGSMWGVVPKAMWEHMTPAADDNTIRLALRPFLAERGDVKLVIEVGLGDRWEDKWRSIYHIEREATLESTLRACGVVPDEVTHVVASHCHFDHIGAMVVERDGELCPLFPKAEHFAPAIEIQVAKHPDHVRRASYRSDDVVPIEAAGLLHGFEGVAEILPGIKVYEAAGHSDGVSVITINEGADGETAIFWADVVPTSHHIQPPYIMAYDMDVARSFESRSLWLEKAADASWLGLFYHDEKHPFGRISRSGKRYLFEPVEGQSG